MKKILLSVGFLFLVAACNAQTSGREKPSIKVASDKKALPVIAVNGSEIKINGTSVWLGDKLDAWKRVLGGSPACYDEGSVVTCVWHSNGLALGTDHIDKTRVTFINLDLTIEPEELGERAPSRPKSPFHGTLELDGIPIFANTVFRDLRRQVAPARDLRCGGRDCGNPSAAFSNGANIYMILAGRAESSRILHFSIACSSTEACMKSMPNQRNQ